jgi:hypothetical protein
MKCGRTVGSLRPFRRAAPNSNRGRTASHKPQTFAKLAASRSGKKTFEPAATGDRPRQSMLTQGGAPFFRPKDLVF